MVSGETELKSAAPPGRSAKRHRKPRIFAYCLTVLLVIVVAGVVGVSWYFSSKALDVSPYHPKYSLTVLALRGNTIELTRTDESMRPGTYGLGLRSGAHITLGAVVSSSQRAVVRRFSGDAREFRAGAKVSFDISVYRTPAELHLKYYTVSVPDPLGSMRAWYVPGLRSTWIVLVHGLGSDLTQSLRPMITLAGLALPMLDISYRNDPRAPDSSDHLYHLGASEWQDVQAGVRYALAHGGRKVILYGYSMGGSLSESFLHRSALAGRVRAVVLDAPALDWNAVFDFNASRMAVPGFITEVAKRFVAWRIGVSNLDEVNDVKPHDGFKVPTLLFQGLADTTVPSSSNADLARADSRHVTYVRVPGAEHVQEWNADPVAYDQNLKRFLMQVLG